MRRNRLKRIIFMALCCDLGLFAKKLILPAANFLTDALHIPGGIGTSFSLMFLVIASAIFPFFGCAAIMGAVQSIIAIAIGSVGSMGALSPIGYIIPGIIIDCIFWFGKKCRLPFENIIVVSNILSSVSASLTANIIVFRLRGIVLLLYLSVAATSGAVCGILAAAISKRLNPVLRKDENHEKKQTDNNHSGNTYNSDC